MPLSDPIQGVNGDFISEIFVPKETTIFIGIRASNRNKSLWGEDADEFKPERWLSPLPAAVGEAHIPGVYANLSASFSSFKLSVANSFVPRMTFLGGGRSCMWVQKLILWQPYLTVSLHCSGFKFSQLEMSKYTHILVVISSHCVR